VFRESFLRPGKNTCPLWRLIPDKWAARFAETPVMNGPDMPRFGSSNTSGSRGFVTGQRVRVTAGPLRDLSGIVEFSADGDRVVINAGENIPGLSISISPAMLESVDS